MMFCRAAWQRLAPLARKTLTPLSNNAVPIRQMSFGLPASGTNIAYMVLGGGSLTAALVYAYKTVNSDSARYNDRIAQIEARSKSGDEALVAFTAASELSVTAEAAAKEPVSDVLVAEPTNAAADIPVAAAAVEVEEAEVTPAVVEALTADAEEPAEDADAAAPVAGATAIPMSDLLSTVRIIAGSTAEIAAASIGDQHLVAAVRLAEEKHSVETLNGVELPDVKVLVPEEVEGSVTEKEVNEEIDVRSNAEGVAITDYDETEANNPIKSEVTDEHLASLEVASEELSGEMENDLALEEALSSVVMPSDDDSISEVPEVTSETVEEDKASCHETVGLEDFTALPADIEQDLQATAGAAEEDGVSETLVDAVEEAEPSEDTEKAVESGEGTMTMEQE